MLERGAALHGAAFITYSLWSRPASTRAMPAMDALKRLALNVQRLRREKGLSQEDLSARADIHQTYLSGVETAKRNPSVKVLDRLAKGLGVDIQVLFQRP